MDLPGFDHLVLQVVDETHGFKVRCQSLEEDFLLFTLPAIMQVSLRNILGNSHVLESMLDFLGFSSVPYLLAVVKKDLPDHQKNLEAAGFGGRSGLGRDVIINLLYGVLERLFIPEELVGLLPHAHEIELRTLTLV